MSRHSSEATLRSIDAFPTRQIVVLAICRLAEPVAFTSVMSYTYVMVQDIKGKENTSLFAGLIVSAFAIAEACSAVFWGSMSDRYGRKSIVMIGLTGTILSCLLLGFAKSYWVALFARLLGGLLNGNTAVIQTMVSEIVRKPEHEPIAYAMHPLTWNIGSVLGSALGGYAAKPAVFYPGWFSRDGLFGKYPYLLPNLVCVVIIGLATIQAAILLEETHPTLPHDDEPLLSPLLQGVDERTPPQTERQQSHYDDVLDEEPLMPSFAAGSLPGPTDPSFDVRRSSFGTFDVRRTSFGNVRPMLHRQIDESDTAVISKWNVSPRSPASKESPFTREVISWILATVLLCYHVLAFTSVLPIYVIDPPQKRRGPDFRGGLGLTIHEVGDYLAVNSIWSLFVQIAIFPVLMAKVGVWNCIIWSTFLCPVIDILVPFISLLPNPGLALHFAFSMRIFFYIMIYPGQLIMLKNAAPSSKALGKVNGLAVSAASIGRTIAPILVGIFYDAFGSAVAWWSCALFCIFSVVQLISMRTSKRSEKDIMRRASVSVVRK